MSDGAAFEKRLVLSGLGFTFRFKLLLAILVVVAVISAGTLWLTNRKLNENYEEFLNRQFEEQVDLFLQKRDTRLMNILETINAATGSVRPIAALKSGNVERLYSDLNYELGVIRERLRDSRYSSELFADPFYRFINYEGQVFDPVRREEGGAVPGMDDVKLAERLRSMATAHEGDIVEPEVKTGYVRFMTADGPKVYEVLVTQLFDFDGSFLGDLVFGIPFVAPASMRGLGDGLRTGLVVEGEMVTREIPEAIAKDMVKTLHEMLESGVVAQAAPPKFDVNLVPHLFFFRSIRPGAGFPPAYHVALFSLEGQQQLTDEVSRLVLLIITGALTLTVLISMGVAHQMTKPILRLIHGTWEVEKGNFTVRVPDNGRDEFGLLARSFNSMTAELALKEQYRAVLDKVTDPDVANQLLGGKLALGGEVREITILFCDIRGFTTWTENMPPSEVIAILNEHMTALTNCVQRNKGVVDKFVGDEIMALFGAPRSYGNDAFNAARAALDMQAERAKLNELGHRHIEIGIGLATGEVVAGCMGSEDRLNYTVLGERVNMASRLCSRAPGDAIYIDNRTVEALGGKAAVKPVQLSLKGFSTRVLAYSLENLRDVEGVESKNVAEEEEVAADKPRGALD